MVIEEMNQNFSLWGFLQTHTCPSLIQVRGLIIPGRLSRVSELQELLLSYLTGGVFKTPEHHNTCVLL